MGKCFGCGLAKQEPATAWSIITGQYGIRPYKFMAVKYWASMPNGTGKYLYKPYRTTVCIRLWFAALLRVVLKNSEEQLVYYQVCHIQLAAKFSFLKSYFSEE